MIKPSRPFLPANRQGIALDAVSILLNLFLFPIFNARIENLYLESFRNNQNAFKTLAGLMLFVLICRLFGLYLKRFPLQRRLQNAEQSSFSLYFWVLSVPVFLMTIAFVVVLLMQFFGKAGIVETNYDGASEESESLSLTTVFGIFFLMGLEVYFLYRLAKPLDRKERQMMAKANWKFDWKTEFLADFGLFSYMVIWQVFYNFIVSVFHTPPGGGKVSFELKIVSLFLLPFCFLVFYLSPRSVFLIEDRRYLGTWLCILLVFLSSIVGHL